MTLKPNFNRNLDKSKYIILTSQIQNFAFVKGTKTFSENVILLSTD